MTPTLSLLGVAKGYGARPVLHDVDLDVAQGQVLALLGPNGAGKSTLVGLAAGLLAPDSGTVRVGGRDPRSGKAADRRLVGLAAQDIALYPSLTARQNLCCFGEVAGLTRREARRRAAEVAEPFALGPLLDRPAGQLSGGEQRRLHAAVALVHRPSLVLLDEPTAGADVPTRGGILEAVRDLGRDGTAVVYTTHYLPEVEQLDAEVALLDAGAIVARGSVGALVAAHARPHVLATFATADAAVAAATVVVGSTVEGAGLRLAADQPDSVLPALLADLDGHVAALVSVDVVRPSLEAAYLVLTGRPPLGEA